MNKKITAILVVIIVILLAVVVCLEIKDNKENNKSNVSTNENTIYKEEEVKDTENTKGNNVEDDDNTQEKELTEDEAIEKLKNTDYEKLDLPVAVSEYTVEMFETTTIDGKECYEMGVFAELENRRTNMGTFAVSKDGTSVYKIVNGEYTEVK